MKNKYQLIKVGGEATDGVCYQRIIFTQIGKPYEIGTIHSISKIYDKDKNVFIYNFDYHVVDGFYTKDVCSNKDIISNKQLIRWAEDIYKNIITKIRFSAQPLWNN